MAVASTPVKALEVTGATVANRITDVNINVAAGTLTGLVGPNGSGKSTILQVAAGLLPIHGNIKWRDRVLEHIPAVERGRLGTWVPQEARFEFGFTVRSVVAQGRYAHGDDEHDIDGVLARLDLLDLAERPVNHLSGGERQRVLLARALVTDAGLQLWDEPLASLDVRHGLEVLVLARELADRGSTVVMSLHDLRVAHCLDAVIVMHKGRMCASGPPDEVLTPELLLEVFGVRASTTPGLTLELP